MEKKMLPNRPRWRQEILVVSDHETNDEWLGGAEETKAISPSVDKGALCWGTGMHQR